MRKYSSIGQNNKKAWVIAADMGYGHQRAAFPLKHIAYQKIFTANSDKMIPRDERKSWEKLRRIYEAISRMASSAFGRHVFYIYDRFQSISPYYPFRDLSKPTFGVLYFDRLIKKKSLCNSILEHAKSKRLPIITTFYLIAIAAELKGIKDIYCIVTDTDINRVWVAKNPSKSKIVYLAPTERAVRRLMEYGVKSRNIHLTGFPLPKENLGSAYLEILKRDIARRLDALDPNRLFYNKYKHTINKTLKIKKLKRNNTPVSLSFSIGGAGAQAPLAIELMSSLKSSILNNKIHLNIIVGMHIGTSEELKKKAKEIGLEKALKKSLFIISELNKKDYFTTFSTTLRYTDILWTKPSELSFYTALGIPIIIAPPIGDHEKQNTKWLIDVGGGIEQKDPKFVNEWIFDLINSGRLAEAAWNGFIDAPNKGIFNIEKTIFRS
jgi:hypothetical protein